MYDGSLDVLELAAIVHVQNAIHHQLENSFELHERPVTNRREACKRIWIIHRFCTEPELYNGSFTNNAVGWKWMRGHSSFCTKLEMRRGHSQTTEWNGSIRNRCSFWMCWKCVRRRSQILQRARRVCVSFIILSEEEIYTGAFTTFGTCWKCMTCIYKLRNTLKTRFKNRSQPL